MAFKDYSLTPANNRSLGDGTYIGPNMIRNKVRPALQQLAADGRDLYDTLQSKINLAKGDPGGNIMAIGLFGAASGMAIPEGTDVVRTSGFHTVGVGAAYYAYLEEVDEDYVTANPLVSFIAEDGRGFVLAEDVVNPFMFGATDATGDIKLTETVVNCSDALDGLCAWWIAAKGKVIMDFSGVTGLGITRTWVWDTGMNSAWWNSPIYRFIPGRLVAMSSLIDTDVDPDEFPGMGYMVHTKGREFHNVGGAWELWPGTDAQVNVGCLAVFARGGLYIEGGGGSSFGKVTGQAFPRYLVQAAKTYTSFNNNIPITFEEIRAVQCGSISDKLYDAVPEPFFGLYGDYYDGEWEGENGNQNQTHRMKIPMTGDQAWLIEIGDLARFNEDKFQVGVVLEVIERTPTYIDLRFSFWQRGGQETGSVVFMQGGAASAWGDKLGSSNFGRVYAFNCATGFQIHSLFSPIAQVISEVCQVGIQLGASPATAIHGFKAVQRHLENCLYTVIDTDVSGNDNEIGADSTTLPDEEGLMGRMFKLQAGFKSGDTWSNYSVKTFQGLRVSFNGGMLEGGAGGSAQISGDTEPFLSNAPPRQFHGPKNMSEVGPLEANQEFTIILNYDRSVGRCINHARTCWIGPIYSNEGTNGAPLGTITIEPDPIQTGITVSGSASLDIPPQTAGAIWLYFVAEPDDIFDPESTVDWKVFMETRPIK